MENRRDRIVRTDAVVWNIGKPSTRKYLRDGMEENPLERLKKALQQNLLADEFLKSEIKQIDRNKTNVIRQLKEIANVKTVVKKTLGCSMDSSSCKNKGSKDYLSVSSLPSTSSSGVKELCSNVSEWKQVEHTNLFPSIHHKIRPKAKISSCKDNSDKLKRQLSVSFKNSFDMKQLQQEEKCGFHEVAPYYFFTNQELRDMIMMKSRFNQIGSKHIGHEVVKRWTTNRRYSDNQGIARNVDRWEERGRHNEAYSSKGINFDSKNLKKLVDFNDQKGILNQKKKSVLDASLDMSKASKTTKEQIQPSQLGSTESTKRNDISHSSLVTSSWVMRNIKSNTSSSSIPVEFLPGKTSKGKAAIEQALAACEDSRNRGEGRQTTQRRFRTLIDTVIKQRKVVNGWTSLLQKVGDIQYIEDQNDK